MAGGMFGAVYYHNTIRKAVIAFGNMFNDIVIRRFDRNNAVLQTIPVPIQYGSKQKYIQNLARDQEQSPVQIQLPMMAFLMTGMNPNPGSKINVTHKNLYVLDSNNKVVKTQFVPIPYKLDFNVSVITKTYDDASQIIEQIIPWFGAGVTQQIHLIPEMGIKMDLKTSFIGMNMIDDYEGDLTTTRSIIWELTFQMDCWFFGPITQAGVIKRIQTDLIVVPGSGKIEDTPDYRQYGRSERIVITPGLTANGSPTSNASLTIPYTQIQADDPYGYVVQNYFFDDGKKFDPESGEDR